MIIITNDDEGIADNESAAFAHGFACLVAIIAFGLLILFIGNVVYMTILGYNAHNTHAYDVGYNDYPNPMIDDPGSCYPNVDEYNYWAGYQSAAFDHYRMSEENKSIEFKNHIRE